jgi:CRP/FNR family transcriptional regulator, anaerobic regulatory protein
MSETAELRARLIRRFPMLAARADELIGSSRVRRMPAGSVLFSAHQPCSGFPLVLEGSIHVSKTAPNGREILLYRVEPGESCILSGSCLLGRSDYSASGITETAVEVLVIPPPLFNELMLQHERFRQYVFGMYSARLSEVMELVEEVAFRKLDTRLAQLLVHRGPIVSETHQKLADELGSVREIVTRLLRSFEQRGWVRLERERVTVLDPKAPADFARG